MSASLHQNKLVNWWLSAKSISTLLCIDCQW